MRELTKRDWHRALQRDKENAQLRDALSGLMDWVNEGCPDGGRYAMVEAQAALQGLQVVTPQTVTIPQKLFATESDDFLRGFEAGALAAITTGERGET